jgi:Sulfotransferase family
MTSDASHSREHSDTTDGPGPTAGQRFFFVHVMKTAGTTFALQLRSEFSEESIYPAKGHDWESPADLERYTDIPRVLGLSAERRSQIRVYTGHFPYMVRELIDPRLVAVTLLRDPVERTISVLKHFKRLDDRYCDMDLEEIYDDDHIFRSFIHNYQTAVFSRTLEDGVQPIRDPISVDERRLAFARDNLAKVQVVGLTSRYAEFVDELRARFGWWPTRPDRTGRANVSSEAWEVPPALRQRIADDNAYDMEFFRYTEDLVTERCRARKASYGGG